MSAAAPCFCELCVPHWGALAYGIVPSRPEPEDESLDLKVEDLVTSADLAAVPKKEQQALVQGAR